MAIERYGKYQLLRKLAVGGMAEIFLARQPGLEGFEKILVIKRILPQFAGNKDFVTMFLDEARLAAQLNHPNVVQIFDLGKTGDSYFIAMEYIPGENIRRLEQRVQKRGELIPVEYGVRIVADAAGGLAYAHASKGPDGTALNIVHRDVSPQNILVSYGGAVKIVDFGIAKAATKAFETQAGVLKGKYSYMSPEQARGRNLDRRSDIYALGIILYELTTGQRLFKYETEIEIIAAIIDGKMTSPSERVEGFAPELEDIIMRALAKVPEDRYQDASELQMALEEFLLNNRLAATTAHMGHFMRGLFSDKIEALEQMNRAQAAVAAQERAMADNLMAHDDPEDFPLPPELGLLDVASSAMESSQPSVPARQTASSGVFSSAIPGSLAARARAVSHTGATPSGVFPDGATPSGLSGSGISGLSRPGRSTVTGAYLTPSGVPRGQPAPSPKRSWLLRVLLPLILVILIFSVALIAAMALRLGPFGQGPTEKKLVVEGRGILEVTSSPEGAAIHLNNQDTGQVTPAVLTNVEVGKPLVVLLQKGEYEAKTEVVTLEPGQVEAKIAVTMVPVEGTAAAKNIATLVIKSEPGGAIVVMDDQHTNQSTPATLKEVEAGAEHQVLLQKEGYEDDTFAVTVEPGQVKVVNRTLEAMKEAVGGGTLQATSVPPGAAILVKGRNTGRRTPAEGIPVPSGRVRVSLVLEGYDTYTKDVRVQEDQEVRVVGKLAKEREKGTLTLSSEPPCSFKIGARTYGPGTFTATLPSGDHRVTLENRSLGITYTTQVKVEPNRAVTKHINVSKGTLKIKVKPWARVMVDGRDIGTTPIPPEQLWPGSHSLVLTNSQMGKSKSATVKIQPGKTTTFEWDAAN